MKRWKKLLLLKPLLLVLISYTGSSEETAFLDSLAEYSTIHTIVVQIDQNYSCEGRPIPDVSLPFRDSVAEIFAFAGVKTLEFLEGCEAVLKIQVEGEAEAAEYFADPGIRYSGATVNVKLSFLIGNRVVYAQSFMSSSPAPFLIPEDDHLTPASAPFSVVLPDFTREMMELLGRIHGPEILVTRLREAAGFGLNWDPEKERLGTAAGEALANIRNPRTVELLLELLEDRTRILVYLEELHRDPVCWILGKMRDPRAVPELIEVLDDEDDWFLNEAASALGEIQDPRAIAPLISAWERLESEQETGEFEISGVRQSIYSALERITGESFGDDLLKWQEWLEKQ